MTTELAGTPAGRNETAAPGTAQDERNRVLAIIQEQQDALCRLKTGALPTLTHARLEAAERVLSDLREAVLGLKRPTGRRLPEGGPLKLPSPGG